MNSQKRLRHSLIIGMAIAAVGASAVALAAPTDSPDHSSSIGAAISDTAITSKVKATLATDGRLKGSDVDVETNNGVVTLTGTAASARAKDAAEDVTKNVSGVRSVNNNMTAPSVVADLGTKAKRATRETAEAISDTALTSMLKAKYGTDSKLKGTDVDVTTKMGTVTLSGSVASESQKTHVAYVAKHTKGVKQVDTTGLHVAGDAVSY